MSIVRIIILFCWLSGYVFSQGLDLQWANNLGSTSYDHCSGMVLDSAENIYVSGYFSGTFQGHTAFGASDGFIAKYSNDGTLQWIRSFGGINDDRATHLAIDTASQRLLITGFYSDKLYFGNDSLVAQNGDDLLLLCMDTDGQWQWGRGFGTYNTQWGNRVAVDREHHIYLSGFFEDTLQADAVQLVSRGLRNAFILQFDSSGICNWGYRMGGALYDEGSDIAFDTHNNVYMVGSYRDSADFGPWYFTSVYTYDCFLASWKPDGQWRWVRSFGGGYIDICQSLCFMPGREQLALGGWFFSNISFDTLTLQSSGEEESFLAVYDTSGQLQWAKRFGHIFAELIYDLCADENDNIYAIGSFDSIMYLGNDVFVAKHFNKPTDVFVFNFTAGGQYITGFQAGDQYNDFGYHIALADSSMLYISGNYQNKTVFSPDTLHAVGQYDIFLAKYYFDSTYLPPPIAVTVLPSLLSSDLKLYPNPTTDGQCCLEADLPPCAWGESLALNVYNAMGHLCHRQKINEQGAGIRCFLNLSHLNSGTYFIQLKGNCYETSGKMQLR